jgi:hypothetical protein
MTKYNKNNNPDFLIRENKGILGLYITGEDLINKLDINPEHPFLFHTGSRPSFTKNIEYISAPPLADLLKNVKLRDGTSKIPHLKYEPSKISHFDVAYVSGHVPYSCEGRYDIDVESKLKTHGAHKFLQLRRAMPQVETERKIRSYGTSRRVIWHLFGK